MFILLVILAASYGLIGLPTFPTSLAQLKDNFGHQIKLGLDLQGGTHLILQVQVQEAIAQETDQTVDRLTSQMRDEKYSLRGSAPRRRHAHPGAQCRARPVVGFSGHGQTRN